VSIRTRVDLAWGLVAYLGLLSLCIVYDAPTVTALGLPVICTVAYVGLLVVGHRVLDRVIGDDE
jgi:hypothetical protein